MPDGRGEREPSPERQLSMSERTRIARRSALKVVTTTTALLISAGAAQANINPFVPAAQAAETCNGLAVTITGTAGNDMISGTAGNDVISAGPGTDVVRASSGADTVCLGPG